MTVGCAIDVLKNSTLTRIQEALVVTPAFTRVEA